MLAPEIESITGERIEYGPLLDLERTRPRLTSTLDLTFMEYELLRF